MKQLSIPIQFLCFSIVLVGTVTIFFGCMIWMQAQTAIEHYRPWAFPIIVSLGQFVIIAGSFFVAAALMIWYLDAKREFKKC